MKARTCFTIFGLYLSAACMYLYASEHSCTSHVYKHKPRVSKLQHVTNISRLPPDLACLRLNNPVGDLTGYAFYQNVAFDPQIAVNPKNCHNIVIVAQQDLLSNARYNAAVPLSVIVLYTFDGGETWNQSNLVLSRAQGATNYKANNNFLAAYFPSVTFDSDGNCYVMSTSYSLFAADHKPQINLDEGNIVVKSVDGGKSWTRAQAAFRDDGSCHFLDFSQIKGDPYRKHTLYIVAADETCGVADSCTDPSYNGNQNITFQKSSDAGTTWSQVSLIASIPADNINTCTPIPAFNQLEVLPDHDHTLLVTSCIQESVSDVVDLPPPDRILAFRSKDCGNTWTSYTVADNIPHVIVVDPDTPILPVTDFVTKDMTVSHCNGNVYIVYSDPLFNPTGQAGCVIRRSKDGGKTWSNPRPVNPKTVGVQTFLPTVAVAKDGVVGVLFYDFREFVPGNPKLSTDVWLSLFDEDLQHHYGEVRLTPESFDARLSIRGYNGVDPVNCLFDYYLSAHVGLKAAGNDFIASFIVTNGNCNTASIAEFPCDSFPLFTDDCNRQDVTFVRIHRHD